MKKYLFIIVGLVLGAGVSTQAATILFPTGGGTGWGNIQTGTLLTGNGTGRLATTTIGSGLNLSGGVLTATAGGNAFQIATTSTISVPQLAYFTKTGGLTTLGGVSTTTLSASGVLSLSQPVSVLGGSASALTLTGGTAGQVLAWLSGVPTWIATTTFSGGVAFSGGNVTNTLTAGDGLTRTVDDIDCDTASGSVFGCLSAADWTTFNNKGSGTVTNIATTYPILGGPITTTGTLSLAFGTTTANTWSGLQAFTNTSTTTFAGSIDIPHARYLTTHGVRGDASDGLYVLSNNYTPVANFGVGNTANSIFSGAVNIDGNTRLATSLNGLLKATSGAISAASSGTDYEVPLTFGDGLTRTVNDADCDIASASAFGCLTAANWTTFNNKWDLASSTIGVPYGGTGATTLTGLLQGNGTSAVTGVGGTIGQFPYYNGTNTLLATSTISVSTKSNVGVASTTPFYKLSVGTKGSSYGTIASTENKIATSTSMTVDWRNGNQQLIQTGTAATAIAFSNALPGTTLRLVVCNPDASAGAITYTGVLWSGGTAPSQTTTANKCDVLSFVSTQATTTAATIIFGAASSNF